jgi:hypothetical protein
MQRGALSADQSSMFSYEQGSVCVQDCKIRVNYIRQWANMRRMVSDREHSKVRHMGRASEQTFCCLVTYHRLPLNQYRTYTYHRTFWDLHTGYVRLLMICATFLLCRLPDSYCA